MIKLRVFIVEDEPWIRRGIRFRLETLPEIVEVVGEASSCQKALESMRRTPDIHVLLTDIVLPDETGFTLIRKARQIFPDLIIYIISGYSEFEYAKEAIELGVSGYLVKPLTVNELEHAMEKTWRQVNSKLLCGHSPDQGIDGIREYIKTHYREELSLEILADQFHVNPTYLSRCFSETYGEGISKFIARTRIDAACVMLLETTLSNAQIAEALNFNDVSYFTKVFKKFTGTTPSLYRKFEHENE